jgi:hypothetical protein
MRVTKSARPRLAPEARAKGEQGRTYSIPAYATTAAASTGFLNPQGRVVGSLVHDDTGLWLEKKVCTTKHQYKRRPAWAVDTQHLIQLRAIGARGVRLVDERGRIWTATLGDFARWGFRLDHGHGEQRALPLERWRSAAHCVYQPGLFPEVS